MKFAVVGGLGLLALILVAAGLTTPFAKRTETQGTATRTTWVSLKGYRMKTESSSGTKDYSYSWSEVNDLNNGKCDRAIHMVRSTLAIGIISCIFSGFGFLAGLASFKVIRLGKVSGFLLLIGALFSFAGWGLAVANYTAPMCGDDTDPLSKQDFKMGPCPLSDGFS